MGCSGFRLKITVGATAVGLAVVPFRTFFMGKFSEIDPNNHVLLFGRAVFFSDLVLILVEKHKKSLLTDSISVRRPFYVLFIYSFIPCFAAARSRRMGSFWGHFFSHFPQLMQSAGVGYFSANSFPSFPLL